MIERRPNLPCMDGVRGLACLLVLTSHSLRNFLTKTDDIRSYTISAGKLGVLMFFVLTGFMMMYHYYTPQQRSWRYWAAFFTRRFLRIYPAYVFTVVVYCLFNPYTQMQFKNIGRYVLELKYNTVTHLWSIPPEIKFYLLFPFLSLGLLILPASTRIKSLLLLVFCVTFYILDFDVHQTALLGNVKCFVAGMFACYLCLNYPLKDRLTAIQCNLLGFAAITALLGSILFLDQKSFYFPRGDAQGWLISCTVLLLYAAPYCTGAIAWLFTNRLVRLCGITSFSLYLIHPLIIRICKDFLERGTADIFIVGVGSIFIAGMGMYHYIEKPCNQLGRRLSQKILS